MPINGLVIASKAIPFHPGYIIEPTKLILGLCTRIFVTLLLQLTAKFENAITPILDCY
jgi:hypothetical protein